MADNCVVTCCMCLFQCYSHKSLLKHTLAVHQNDPRFMVNCSVCGKSATKWETLRKHLRKHGKSANEIIHNNRSSIKTTTI